MATKKKTTANPKQEQPKTTTKPPAQTQQKPKPKSPANPTPAQIAAFLAGPNPLSFKRYPDGAMVIIDSRGRKARFAFDLVQAAVAEIQAKKS